MNKKYIKSSKELFHEIRDIWDSIKLLWWIVQNNKESNDIQIQEFKFHINSNINELKDWYSKVLTQIDNTYVVPNDTWEYYFEEWDTPLFYKLK